MTNRRWMVDGEDTPGPGPLEMVVRAELEGLGWTPLTPPGPFLTAVTRAWSLAETYDRSQNAAALPGLDRQLAAVMDDARRVAGLEGHDLRDSAEEVSDFERERQRRRPPAG